MSKEMEGTLNILDEHYNQGLDHAITLIREVWLKYPESMPGLAMSIKMIKQLKIKPEPINTNTNE